MVLLRVDFEPLAMKLQELLDKHGVVDIVCYQRMFGTVIPIRIMRIRKTDYQSEIDSTLLELSKTICSLIELKVLE